MYMRTYACMHACMHACMNARRTVGMYECMNALSRAVCSEALFGDFQKGGLQTIFEKARK